MEGSGLWSATKQSGAGSAWARISSTAFPVAVGRISLSQQRSNQLVLYALFGGSTWSDIAGIAKSLDGGSTWPAFTVRLNTTVYGGSSLGSAHLQSADVHALELTSDH